MAAESQQGGCTSRSSRPLGAAGIPGIPGALERRPTLSKEPAVFLASPGASQEVGTPEASLGPGSSAPAASAPGAPREKPGGHGGARPQQPPPSCPWAMQGCGRGGASRAPGSPRTVPFRWLGSEPGLPVVSPAGWASSAPQVGGARDVGRQGPSWHPQKVEPPALVAQAFSLVLRGTGRWGS